MYYTYMLRCEDNSIYTGMTNDLSKRFNEHLFKTKNGAKYTKSHSVIKIEAAWKSKDKSLACKLRIYLKFKKKGLLRVKNFLVFLAEILIVEDIEFLI